MSKKCERQRFSNVSNEQPLSIAQMARHLAELTEGWPKVVGANLYWQRDDALVAINTVADLFAFVDQHAIVIWKGGGVSKEEFFAGLMHNAEAFAWHSRLPHFPPLSAVLYTHAPVEPRKTGALDELVDCYTPATSRDRHLIKAAYVTTFWGGPSGQRPAICITAKTDGEKKGRGAGKSSLMQHIAKLAGGYISCSQVETRESLMPRLLSPQALAYRVITLDNLKTRRFASATLESLITDATISGKRLYAGEGSRPNYLTVITTVNGPGFGLDMSDRLIVIKLGQRPSAQGWEAKVSNLLTTKRDAILADIAYLMSKPPKPITTNSRWATWCQEVLARVCKHPQPVIDLIERRQRRIDVDTDDDQRVIQTIREHVADMLPDCDLDTTHIEIPSATVAGWARATKPELGQRATQYLKTLAINELKWKHTSRGDVFVWRGKQCAVNSKPMKK